MSTEPYIWVDGHIFGLVRVPDNVEQWMESLPRYGSVYPLRELQLRREIDGLWYAKAVYRPSLLPSSETTAAKSET